MPSISGVAKIPGMTEFTRIPMSIRSRAIGSTSPFTPALQLP